MKCKECIHYQVHPLYTQMGYCPEMNKLVYSDDSCESFVRTNSSSILEGLNELGWVYCAECRDTLFDRESLTAHLNKGHTLVNSLLEDIVAKEESPGGA